MASLPRELPEFLDQIVERFHRPEMIGNDPLQFPRRYSNPNDQEVVALLAACLAWGRVAQIANVMNRLLERLGDSPSETLRDASKRDLATISKGIVHRVLTSEDLAVALGCIGRAVREHGSLGAIFEVGEDGLMGALAHFVGEIRRGIPGEPTRGLKHLFPDPRGGSACKRWMLFLRWVVRPSDEIDLGLWGSVSPGDLIIPLDTHIHRIATNLRLTRRRDASLKTATEITAALRDWQPEDPVACDFALTRLGIHQVCPSKVDPVVCSGCELRTVCRHGSSD